MCHLSIYFNINKRDCVKLCFNLLGNTGAKLESFLCFFHNTEDVSIGYFPSWLPSSTELLIWPWPAGFLVGMFDASALGHLSGNNVESTKTIFNFSIPVLSC